MDTQESKQACKRYEALFYHVEDMVFFFREDGSVYERNEAVKAQCGYDSDDALMMQDVFRTSMRQVDGKLELVDHKPGERFETVAYRKNQTCFSVTAYVVLLGEETGCYGMCSVHNIAKETETLRELKVAQVEADVIHKERNEFVANVTHELRTPVNGVMGLAQNLLDTNLDTEQRETIEVIEECCKNMIKIINNILDFSKLQSGKFTIEYREFSFLKLMDNMVKVHQPQIESKGIKLVCNVADDVPDRIIGDELRITQVLNNLLSNAVKFTSVGQVAVNVSKTVDFDETVELFFMVIDTGIGIAENEKDKLFKSFSQVDASVTRRFGGTGLGLSIVKDLVKMMGGDINVESEKGKGSTFSFSVRVKKAEAAEEDLSEKRKNYSFHFGSAEEQEGNEQMERLYQLGSSENLQEISSNMEKLILCMEMENWEKANSFAENVKQLVAEDANLKRKAFRLQMVVRKGDYEAAVVHFEELKKET